MRDPSLFKWRYFLDLLREPIPDEEGAIYRFEFLTEGRAGTPAGGIFWFPVHEIFRMAEPYEPMEFLAQKTLGNSPVALERPNLFIVLAGSPAVAVRGTETATPQGDMFNPFRVGLDHVALACPDEAELERVAAALSQAGVENTGVKFDETLGKRYVAFKDPDRIAWEFYMA